MRRKPLVSRTDTNSLRWHDPDQINGQKRTVRLQSQPGYPGPPYRYAVAFYPTPFFAETQPRIFRRSFLHAALQNAQHDRLYKPKRGSFFQRDKQTKWIYPPELNKIDNRVKKDIKKEIKLFSCLVFSYFLFYTSIWCSILLRTQFILRGKDGGKHLPDVSFRRRFFF